MKLIDAKDPTTLNVFLQILHSLQKGCLEAEPGGLLAAGRRLLGAPQQVVHAGHVGGVLRAVHEPVGGSLRVRHVSKHACSSTQILQTSQTVGHFSNDFSRLFSSTSNLFRGSAGVGPVRTDVVGPPLGGDDGAALPPLATPIVA